MIKIPSLRNVEELMKDKKHKRRVIGAGCTPSEQIQLSIRQYDPNDYCTSFSRRTTPASPSVFPIDYTDAECCTPSEQVENPAWAPCNETTNDRFYITIPPIASTRECTYGAHETAETTFCGEIIQFTFLQE